MRKSLFVLLAVVGAAACSTDGPAAPMAATGSATATRTNYRGDRRTYYPGDRRTGDALAGTFTPINCVPRKSATGSAVIGPSGGTIYIGSHRLIVPAGAVLEKVEISGTVPEGKAFEVDLQPHGLKFRRAAGLILDASECTDVPSIVYLIDQYNESPPIPAMYSNLWHMIACPIWHFSGYAISLGDGGRGQGESSSQ